MLKTFNVTTSLERKKKRKETYGSAPISQICFANVGSEDCNNVSNNKQSDKMP